MEDLRLKKLNDMAIEELTKNILPWWMKYSPDPDHGGFYCEIDNNNVPVKEANKYITLAARLVWTFSSCYRVVKDPLYKEFAQKAYNDLISSFWDEETEGMHTWVSPEGKVVDAHKFIYGNAFAVYGLSEYYRAFGDKKALSYAKRLYARLEKHVYDPIYGGYFEACTKDWKVEPWLKGVNRLPSDQKTMNTHLHLIEAYTCLLRSDEDLRSPVRRHLYTMINKIVNRDTHHFHYFQDRSWNPTTPEVSFGHDIEASWLMMESAEVLGEPEAERFTRDVCVNMARACLEEGFRSDGAMISEYDPRTGHFREQLSWWEQNEAVVGFLNAWELTGEDKFLDASCLCFDFIDQHFVDHEKGGWFAILSNDGKNVVSKQKSNGPTCPYHNARMCLEIIERCRKHTK